MFGLVKFLLRLNYYYGRLIGVLNFEIDLETGRASLSKRATVYAALVNMLIFAMLPLLITTRVWQIFLGKTNRFHEYVFLMAGAIRISCVFVTMLSRWWQRKRLVQLLHGYRRLVVQQPQVMRLWQRGVITKVITGILTECIHMALGLHGLRDRLTSKLALTLFFMYVIIGLLNVILAQFYFSLLNVHGHYLLINQELRSIVTETRLLELDHRKHLCQIRSCALADRLDSLARLQAQLQSLVQRMTQIFGLQTLCMCIIFNITMISGVYISFTAFKCGTLDIEWTNGQKLLIICGLISYIADSRVTYSIANYVQDLYAEMGELVAQYSTFPLGLDVRLMIAFESFKLQLVHNPQKLSVMGLYCLDRGNVLAMVSALVSCSLILIQYDIQNAKAI